MEPSRHEKATEDATNTAAGSALGSGIAGWVWGIATPAINTSAAQLSQVYSWARGNKTEHSGEKAFEKTEAPTKDGTSVDIAGRLWGVATPIINSTTTQVGRVYSWASHSATQPPGEKTFEKTETPTNDGGSPGIGGRLWGLAVPAANLTATQIGRVYSWASHTGKENEPPGEKTLLADASSGTATTTAKDAAKGAAVGAGVGGLLGSITVPAVHMIGFGAGGISGGSIAASMMSTTAVANGGGVAAGSTVAVLQSVGAAGLGTPVGLGLIAAGVAVGGLTVGAKTLLLKNQGVKPVDSETVE